MNEHKTLEAELATLRPAAPSAGLRERIAVSLGEQASLGQQVSLGQPVSPRRSRGPLWVATLCGPLAAVLTYFLLTGPSQPLQRPDLLEFRTEPLTERAFDSKLPSVWSYRSSLSRSPDELDALLDKHAIHFQTPRPQRAGVYVLSRSETDLKNLLGEL